MKIINKRPSIEPKFKDVLEGECFIYEDNIYMKTEEIVEEFGDGINVTNLETGALGYFDDEEIVEPIETELKIK